MRAKESIIEQQGLIPKSISTVDLRVYTEDLLAVTVAKAEGKLSKLCTELCKLLTVAGKARADSLKKAESILKEKVKGFVKDIPDYSKEQKVLCEMDVIPLLHSSGPIDDEEIPHPSLKFKFDCENQVVAIFEDDEGKEWTNTANKIISDLIDKNRDLTFVGFRTKTLVRLNGHIFGKKIKDHLGTFPDLMNAISSYSDGAAKCESISEKLLDVRTAQSNIGSYERQARAALAENIIKQYVGGEDLIRAINDIEGLKDIAKLENLTFNDTETGGKAKVADEN